MIFKSWPEIYDWFGILFYGPRGSCKSIHQSKWIFGLLHKLEGFSRKHPELPRMIVISNQKFTEKWEKLWLHKVLFYWEKLEDIHYCPNPKCWLIEREGVRHAVHDAVIVFDDITTILPPDAWNTTPMWFRKMLAQARHNGVHVLANCQDPNAIDINFRRYIDVAYKFRSVIKTRDPEKTKPPVKPIFGIYQTRRVKADILYSYGDLPEQQIRINLIKKEEQNAYLKKIGKSYQIVYDGSWIGGYHFFTRRHTEVYDTTQNVKAKEITGFICKEIKCIDPAHIHAWDEKAKDIPLPELKKMPNYCNHIKRIYEMV